MGYTDEELIEYLIEVDKRIDGSLSYHEYKDLSDEYHPSVTCIQRRFGGWNAAKETAGIVSKARGGGKKYKKEYIISLLQKYDLEVNGPLGTEDYDSLSGKNEPCSKTVSQYFDGWQNAKEEAGIELSDLKKMLTLIIFQKSDQNKRIGLGSY